MLLALISGCFREKRSDNAAGKMQEFVIEISKYARGIDPDFIIIPQNGVELGFNNIDPSEGFNADYLNAIDGMGVEELFYDGELTSDEERLGMLRKLRSTEKILSAEFVTADSQISDAFQRNDAEGFSCFVRNSANYDYKFLPDSVHQENNNNIHTLADAANHLYMISNDQYTSKQDMLNAISATNFDVVLIDLFFEEEAFSSSEIQQLKTKANGASRLVIAYMNIGSAENFRYYWKKGWGLHHPLWLKKKYDGYKDEFWVKFWKKDWQKIIYGNDDSYTKKILDAGFDGVYLDNVEAYYFLYFKSK